MLPSVSVPRSQRRTPCTEQHDLLDWSVGCAYSIDGYTLGLRANDAEALAFLVGLVPGRARPVDCREVRWLFSFHRGAHSGRSGVKNFHRVYLDCELVHRTLDLKEAEEAISSRFSDTVRRFAVDRVYLHGSVLRWKDRGLVLLGSDDTLRRMLLALDCREFADEVIVDDAGRLLTWNEDTPSLRPGFVLRTWFQPGIKFSPAKLTSGKLTLDLFNLRKLSFGRVDLAMSALGVFAQKTQGYEGPRGEATDLLDFLEKESPG